MAKTCIQCERKIGMFKSPIEGIYCSYDCRNAAREAIAESERRSQERVVLAKRIEEERAAESARHALIQQAHAHQRANCPKCSSEWTLEHRAGAGGPDRGSCRRCGFAAEFFLIEPCPVCKCDSLVIAADDARCPRCKYRRHAEQLAG